MSFYVKFLGGLLLLHMAILYIIWSSQPVSAAWEALFYVSCLATGAVGAAFIAGVVVSICEWYADLIEETEK